MNKSVLFYPVIKTWIVCKWLTLLLLAQNLMAQEITVPVDDYPPWKLVSGNRVEGGIDLRLTEALLSKLNLHAKYVVCPWEHCLYFMESGEADLISGITPNSDRNAFLSYFRLPYKNWSIKAFYVPRGKGNRYQQLSDFEGKKIGILRGAHYFSELKDNEKIIKYEVNNDDLAFRMLASGRLDAVVTTLENGNYILSRLKVERKTIEPARFQYRDKVSVFFAISRRSPLVSRQHELEEALEKMIISGEVKKILSQVPADQD